MGWLGNAWDKVSGAVVSLGKAETWQAVGNGISSAASTVAGGVSKAASWTHENVLKPTGHAIAVTARAATGDAEAQREFGKAMDATGKALVSAGNAVVDYTKWAATNPGMFLRQAGQGLSNSVVGLGALVADAGRWAGEGVYALGHNTFAGVVNLGADKDKTIIDYYKMSKFSYLQDMAENSILYNYMGNTREELNEMVRKGQITERDASFAAGTKYATQAIGEVGSIVLVGAVTAGAGGVALGAARGGALGVRAVRVADAISKAGRLGEIAAKPLYWMGRNPTLAYLERAAVTAAEAPKPGPVGFVMRGPLRAFDPAQTEHAFASLASRPLFQNHVTLANGLRAAEGGFKWLNPLQANGRSVVAWSIEGGGAALSYTVNSAKENAAAAQAQFAVDVGTQNNSVEANRQRYLDSLREYGIDPATAPTYEQAVERGLFPAPTQTSPPQPGTAAPTPPAEGTATPPATPQPLRPDFQSNALKDEGITHVFTIEGFEGLKQPSPIDPLARDGAATARPQVAPGMGNGNR